MNSRTLEKMIAVMIIATCAAGLIFAFGIFTGFTTEGLKMYSVLLSFPVLIYYLFEFRRLKNNGRGFLFPDVRCWLMLAVWNMALISLLYLNPMHNLEPAHMKAADFALMKLLPVEMFLDWMAGRKGTFHADYVIKSYLLLIPYTAAALLLGKSGHGFGLGTMTYPYPFMNADQLGWTIVWGNLAVIFGLTYCAGILMVMVDYMLAQK